MQHIVRIYVYEYLDALQRKESHAFLEPAGEVQTKEVFSMLNLSNGFDTRMCAMQSGGYCIVQRSMPERRLCPTEC